MGQSSFWIATLREYGLMWILYPALLVIVNDTMAYVFGMLFGKHALLPVISPKKDMARLYWSHLGNHWRQLSSVSKDYFVYFLRKGGMDACTGNGHVHFPRFTLWRILGIYRQTSSWQKGFCQLDSWSWRSSGSTGLSSRYSSLCVFISIHSHDQTSITIVVLTLC